MRLWPLVFALASCNPIISVGPPAGSAPPAPAPGMRPPPARFALDLLFVLSDRATMAPVQRSLQKWFPEFLASLRQPLGELPDLHIGVITSSLGAGAFTTALPDCAEASGGRLVTAPRVGSDVICETSRIA